MSQFFIWKLTFLQPWNIAVYSMGMWHVCVMHEAIIRLTRPWNLEPRKPLFKKVNLGFTRVYIILARNINCGYSLEPIQWGGSISNSILIICFEDTEPVANTCAGPVNAASWKRSGNRRFNSGVLRIISPVASYWWKGEYWVLSGESRSSKQTATMHAIIYLSIYGCMWEDIFDAL